MKRELRLLAVLLVVASVAAAQSAPARGERRKLNPDIAQKIRKAAKLFDSKGKDLVQKSNAAKKDLVITPSDDGLRMIPETLDVTTANRYIEYAAKQSDLIVIGTVRFQFSSLNESRSSLFTLVPFDVEQIIKPHQQVTEGSQITVLRSGGRMRVNGHKLIVNDKHFKPFRTGGRYLLFLRYNTETNSYLASGIDSYKLLENEVRPLSGDDERNPVTALLSDPKEFLGAVRSTTPHAQ